MKAAAKKGEQARIEYVPLAEILRAPRNPKQHDGATLVASVERFGFVQPLLVDERTGRLVAGHGRLEALQAMKAAGKQPPARVQERGGDWLVPVIRGVSFADEREAEAYLVADNRLVEIGGWDERELAEMFSDFKIDGSLEGLGFSSAEMNQIVDSAIRATTEEDPDDLPDVSGIPYVRTGDLYSCGNHKVFCGSCVDLSKHVVVGEAHLLITDPPYGVSYSEKNRFLNAIARGNRIQEPIENDHQSPQEMGKSWTLWFSSIRPLLCAGASYYVTGPQGGDLLLLLLLSLRESGFPLRHMLIWAKNCHVLGRSDYHYQHEPILYGWTDGASHRRVLNRSETSLWEIPKPHKSELHPTMKPVALYERAMQNSSSCGDTVLDPFLGSGTCLIAGEHLGRRVIGSELDPHYAQVSIERWQRFTGKKAELVHGN